VKVRTIWRDDPLPKESKFNDYIAELNKYICCICCTCNSADHQSIAESGAVKDLLGLVFPSYDYKTRYKIHTPPTIFFQKLNLLLRNMGQVKHMIFASFTLTDAFVQKYLSYVDGPINLVEKRFINAKRKLKVDNFFILNNELLKESEDQTEKLNNI